MPIALNDADRDIALLTRSFLSEQGGLRSARVALESEEAKHPDWWQQARDLGWLGMHLPNEVGGAGMGLSELALVAAELGRVLAPGAFVPTTAASAVLVEHRESQLVESLLRGLASGEVVGAVGTADGLVFDEVGQVHGDAGPVLGAAYAAVFLLVVGVDVAVFDATSAGVSLQAGPQLDATRISPRIRCTGAVPRTTLRGAAASARRLLRLLLSAEAAGAAAACVDAATSYALTREQFGRVIGTFQAVKHICADMHTDATLAAALAWDAARAEGIDQQQMTAAAAAAGALPAFQRCARRNIQVHGGIGFTWEHDAHLFLRRATAVAALQPSNESRGELLGLMRAGVRRRPALELPTSAHQYRAEASAVAGRAQSLDDQARRELLVESGYLVPHWPEPWGRGADAIEQLVIDEEFAQVSRPHLGIGGWVLLTIAQEGTNDQRERWVKSGLLGTSRWCQLFSEPGAGSDAAAVATRGVRVDGGWIVNGQKIWTTNAQDCDMGLATVRTDPTAPKHRGITMMALDLRAPGVEVRPLRELTGDRLFNEVFLTDVFVPDSDVVGTPGQGWSVARATLRNERVSIGGTTIREVGTASELLGDVTRFDDALAALVVEQLAIQAINLSEVARLLTETAESPRAGTVTKLMTAEHAQRVTELALQLAGSDVINNGDGKPVHSYLFARCLTIAGGTSEILRNQIAERLLGLPRETLT